MPNAVVQPYRHLLIDEQRLLSRPEGYWVGFSSRQGRLRLAHTLAGRQPRSAR